MMDTTIIKYIESELSKVLFGNINIFDHLISICESYSETPFHSLAELKKYDRKKLKGDLFEHFCYKYLLHCCNMTDVWLYKDFPMDKKKEMNLTKNDYGIDLISKDKDDNYYAIQAKYRKRVKNRKCVITWKQLSTFYALVLKSGPFKKHIVMTNADFITHIGKKTDKDKTIAYKSLRNISLHDWKLIAGLKEDKHILTDKPNMKLSKEDLRKKRLDFFS